MRFGEVANSASDHRSHGRPQVNHLDSTPRPQHEKDAASGWSPRAKLIASILVAFHVFAVFAAPCASPPPASDTWQWIAGRLDGKDGWLTPYLRAAYLNHGYRFFAPNPGPSHLVRYEIDLQSGGKIEGKFPDPEEHFPRLLYHRMFMLSETAFNMADPVLTLPEAGTLTEAEQRTFDLQLAAADELADSIARRFLAEHNGKRIRLYLQTHELPFPNDVAAGQKLDDPKLIVERFWRELSSDQLRGSAESNDSDLARNVHSQNGATR